MNSLRRATLNQKDNSPLKSNFSRTSRNLSIDCDIDYDFTKTFEILPEGDPRINKKLFVQKKSKKLITKLFNEFVAKYVFKFRYYILLIFVVCLGFNSWNIFANLEQSSRNMEVLKQSNGLRKFNDWTNYELW